MRRTDSRGEEHGGVDTPGQTWPGLGLEMGLGHLLVDVHALRSTEGRMVVASCVHAWYVSHLI